MGSVMFAIPETVSGSPGWQLASLGILLLAGWGHLTLRGKLGRRLLDKTVAGIQDERFREGCVRSIRKNICWWRSIWRNRPAGWNRSKERAAGDILERVDAFIQKLNDIYTDPSGRKDGEYRSETASGPQQEQI